jgi:hypothetical protein
MDDRMDAALVAAEAERAIDPVAVDRQLTGASPDECRLVFDSLRVCAANYLVGTAICVGRALESAGYGDKAGDELARAWDVSRSTIYRLGKIYREIVRPRLDAQGQNAAFVLDESTFYVVAVEQAPKVERPAIELLEHAEEQRLAQKNYSIRDFKADIAAEIGTTDEGSTSSDAPKVDRLFGRLSEVDDASVNEWAQWARSRPDSRKKIQRVEDALTAVDLAVRLMRQQEQA